jgi:hypothetical protein
MFKEPKAVSALLGPADGDTPETILIKKESFLRLSGEAKEVLRTLIRMPEEFLGFDRDRLAAVRKKNVANTFRKKKKWTVRTTNRAFRQVEEFWRLF